MPKFSQNALALGGNVMVILSEDQFKKEAGWELVKHMLKEENQTDFALSTGYLPIRKSSQQNPKVQELFISNPLYKIAFEQLDYTWAYLHFSEMGTMDAMFWYALDEIEKAVLSPKAALDKAAASLIKEME
jgi:ABC-type glycerol-3-phosphate transport system substrate-binding protein